MLKGKHILKNNNKKITMLVSLVLVFVVTVTTVCAYILTRTEVYGYQTVAAQVVCEELVTRNLDYTLKSVKVKNNGNADAYVRLQIVAMYRHIDDDYLHWSSPVHGTDYQLKLTSNWFRDDTNGYIYYKQPIVANGGITDELIDSLVLTNRGNPPTDFEIVFDVLVSGIQAEPDGRPAEEVWGVNVENGVITN